MLKSQDTDKGIGLCRASLAVELQRGDEDNAKDKAKEKAADSDDSINIIGTIKLPKASGDAAKGKEEQKK